MKSLHSIRDGGNGRMDGIGNIRDIILIQSRHADSSRFQQVNVEFANQQLNLFLCKKKKWKISSNILAIAQNMNQQWEYQHTIQSSV